MTDDELHDAIADEYRREILLGLLEDDRLSISKLTGVTRELANADDALLDRHLSSDRRVPRADEAVLRQYHVHLPKLDTYGYIEWDRDASVVRKGDRFNDARPLLELLEELRSDSKIAV